MYVQSRRNVWGRGGKVSNKFWKLVWTYCIIQEEGGAYYSHNVGMSQPSFTTFLRPLTYAIPIAITFASAAVEAQKVKAIKRGRARKCYYMVGFMKYCSKFMFFIIMYYLLQMHISRKIDSSLFDFFIYGWLELQWITELMAPRLAC